LRGVAAVGPGDAAEADRVWRSIEADGPDLETLYKAGLRQHDNPGLLDRQVRAARLDVEGDTPVALALRRSATVHACGGDDLSGLLDRRTCVATPLRGQRSVVGVLYADNVFSGRQLDPDAELVFSLVADHAGRAIELAHEFERVARQARSDSLTGLGHHGAMMEAVQSHIGRARDNGAPLGVAMLDLDDFKRVNDIHGHLVGDALLVAIAARLRRRLRAGAEAYRYGGEEFAVVLPHTNPEEMATVGERLRRVIGDDAFLVATDTSLRITCSVGMAAWTPALDSADLLMGKADQALLRAKRGGKNRVELA
jgi:diguanylate cyclase (GGDEF)-like protein